MKKIMVSILSGVLTLSFLITPIYGASLEDELKASDQRKAQAKQQVETSKNTIDVVAGEIDTVNESINGIEKEIDVISKDVKKIEEKIEKKEAELIIAQEKKALQEAGMGDRVRALYMYGNESILEFLFTAKDFSDFISKLDMSKYIVSADKDSLRELEKTKETIDEKKDSIEVDRFVMVEKRIKEEKARDEQVSVKAQKEELISQNEDLVSEYTAKVEAEEEMGIEIGTQLEAYYAQQKREAEEAATTANNSGAYVDTSDVIINTSGYVWPASGPITSPFGTRIHPIYGSESFHSGVDIGASTGTSVAAAGNGTVISAGWNGGYGNCVIIDMGNGLSSLYGHLSAIYVSEGQSVSAGQSLGAVGSTGASTGPHLHFEMRSYGSAVNPYNYY